MLVYKHLHPCFAAFACICVLLVYVAPSRFCKSEHLLVILIAIYYVCPYKYCIDKFLGRAICKQLLILKRRIIAIFRHEMKVSCVFYPSCGAKMG